MSDSSLWNWEEQFFGLTEAFATSQLFSSHLHGVVIFRWISKERVVAILQPLVDAQIDSRASLAAKWAVKPDFLMHA